MRRQTPVSVLWFLVGAVAWGFCPAACQKEPGKQGADTEGGKLTVEETFCGKVSEGFLRDTFETSPDGKHAVYVTKRGGKYAVVVDGVEHAAYDSVLSQIIFSPDAKRVAYVAWRGTKRMVVIDGKEGKEYDGVDDSSLAFSPDSQRFVYSADDGGKRMVVTDGTEGKKYDRILMGPVFSGNSKHVGYVAKCGDKKLCVIDGVEGKEYDEIAWAGGPLARDFGRQMPAQDYPIPPEHYPIWIMGYSPFFGPEENRTAYIGSIEAKAVLVIDSKETMELDLNTDFILSPDRKHFAGVVSRESKDTLVDTVVRDGTPGREYESVEQLLFSPDSKHVAYLGHRDNHTYVVLDGKEVKEYDMAPRLSILVFDGPNSLIGWLDRGGELFRIQVSIKE
ncbi:MAG: hypothetical protein NTX87_06350 [Planctomycetota bacterium]|nr:hypothetical protein [Planctomycetota bacterium]